VKLFAFASLLACALAGACDPGPRIIPGGPTPDAGCLPMPTECPAEQRCEILPTAAGERVCTGDACCVAFCELNACDRCCGPSP
jgi:hypothetical protein